MNKYGYYVVECEKLDADYIETLNLDNYKNKKLVIQVTSTAKIDKDTLLELKNNKDVDIQISVIGPYIDERASSEQEKEKFFYNTLYNLDELYEIIDDFEKIEKDINPNWNQFDIVVYLVETLIRNIMYDPEYYLMHHNKKEIPKKIGNQDMSDYYDRSLRGMLTRKTVCAGYSVIFKELANRNGIDCKYVSGIAYTAEGQRRGGHAWNLVRINNVIYPLDITWKNTKFRGGDDKSIDDISCDVEMFKKRHRPHDSQNNVGLTQIPKDIVEQSKKKTILRRKFSSSTYEITRNNNTKFVVAQIGIYKGLYRYFYSEIDANGNYMMPRIVFSESNFIKEISDHKMERSKHFDEFKSSFINVLFSRENLIDSKYNKKTRYIGCCELPDKKGYVKKIDEITKSEEAIKKFDLDNIRTKQRDDGSYMTFVQLPNTGNNGYKYQYYIYVLAKKPTLLEYNIYSNTNYFEMSSYSVVNSVLTDDKLKESVSNGGIIR